MLRRKMFAYAVIFICGIISAYYIEEKAELFFGTAFMLSAAVTVAVIPLDCREEERKRERIIILSFLISGFVIFSANFILMNGAVRDSKGSMTDPEVISCIEGRILSIQPKNEGYRMTVIPRSYKGMRRVQILYYGDELSDKIYEYLGAQATFYGSLRIPQPAENPECFNNRLYLATKRIRFTMTVKVMRIDSFNDSCYLRYKRRLFEVRDDFLELFSENIRGFIRGVIFGDKSEIDEATIEEFNHNSTGHVLAVSGLHIGFLFSLLKTMTRRRKNKLICALIIVVFILYGEMTAWNASTIRAVMVSILALLHIYFERPFDMLSSISTSAIIILMINPYQLFNVGFQMSFIALTGICFLTPLIQAFTGEMLASQIAVQTAMLPIMIYTFNGFNLMSLFVNIPVVFLSSLLVPLCIMALMIMFVTGSAPLILITVDEGLSELMIRVNRLLSMDGMFYNNAEGISTALVILIYLMMFLLSSEWLRIRILRKEYNRIKTVWPHLLIPVFFLFVLSFNTFSNDEIIFLSVGQGDAVHVRAGSHDLMIDGGGSRDYNVGRNILRPYLLKNGTDDLDMALVTHLHTDHYLGISQLNEVLPIGKIGISDIYDIQEMNGTGDEATNMPDNITRINTGNRIIIDENVNIEIVWPVMSRREAVSIDDENENNIVFIVNYGGLRIMITGDLLEEEEHKMIQYYRGTDVLKCDVLKVGHHGSKTSSSEEFLDAVKPSMAVIQVGMNNMYGHPHQQTLERLIERGIKVYRTDIDGAVGLDIRKKSVHVDTMKCS